MAITQNITPIPKAGKRGVDTRDAFVLKQEAFQDALTDTFVTEINNFRTQANSLEANVNNKEASAIQAATTATGKASEAETSATTATAKANEASTSASIATTKATEASDSAASALVSENSASDSATIATTKASEASNSASSALSSENIATTKANEASNSADLAITKATEASNSASVATTKANEASNSADLALASENAAKASEINAKTSEINAQQYAEVINPDNYVKINENQTIAGIKTFSSAISGSITGNSATATTLQTARTINGVAFDGSTNITIVDSTKAPLNSPALTGSPTAPTPAAAANNTQIATTAFVKSVINSSAAAGVGTCRAWVNFNGTGTVTIRASGNVSSVTDRGVGQYTVNFTIAMPDANYSASCIGENSTSDGCAMWKDHAIPMSTSQYHIQAVQSVNHISFDPVVVQVSIFR